MKRPIKPGDTVMFTNTFCRSVGLYASNDPLVHRHLGAKVTAVSETGMVTMTDAEGEERKALATNLTHTDALEAPL